MTAPTIIVTRAEPGATATAERLINLGIEPIVSPALSLSLVEPLPSIPIDAAAAILFTSANGVRFFSDVSDHRGLPAFCVGSSTFEAAERAGFRSAYNADGDSEDLSRLVASKMTPTQGKLIHIANTHAGPILQNTLVEQGFDVEFVGLYEPIEAIDLSDAARTLIAQEKSICVLIHSAKGAASFANLIAPFTDIQTTFICVSDKAARPISHIGEVRVADRPNEDALLRVVKDWKLAL